MTAAKRRLLTPTQVAEAYDVDVATVRRWLRKGIVAHVLVGPFRYKRIPESEARRVFRKVQGAQL